VPTTRVSQEVGDIPPALAFTKHARDRMAERRIGDQEVAELVAGHSVAYRQPHGVKACCGSVQERPLKVLLEGRKVVTVEEWYHSRKEDQVPRGLRPRLTPTRPSFKEQLEAWAARHLCGAREERR
jgi:hypothetical protein